VQLRHDDLAGVREPHDVAGDLRHRRRDQGDVGGGELQPGGDLASGLPGGDDVGVGAHGDPHGVVPGPSSSHQGSGEPRAQVALQQVAGGVDLALATTVAAGDGQQHGTAALRRRLDPLGDEQVLHPQPGAGAVELRGHRAGGGPQLSGQ
jgi:hypothetical protein